MSASDRRPRNVIQLQTEAFVVTIRPSGTEPKLKLYCQLLPGDDEASKGAGHDLLRAVRTRADAAARQVYADLLGRIDTSLDTAALMLPDIVDLDRKLEFQQTTVPALRSALEAARHANLEALLAWLGEQAAPMAAGADAPARREGAVAWLCEQWRSELRERRCFRHSRVGRRRERSRGFHRTGLTSAVKRASWQVATSLLALLAIAACSPGEPTREAPRLLLLVTVDTLRADHLGAYGSERSLTPNLDALAAESLVFDSAYAPAPFTLPSLATLHTGRYPRELGLQSNLSKLPGDVETTAETLRDRGWKTAAVVSNVVLRGRSDVARGFEIYDDRMLQTEAVRRWPERIAEPTTDAALRIVELWRKDPEASGRPLFLWVHFQDPHGPYTPPDGWRERFIALERRLGGERRLPEVASSHGEGGIPHYQRIGEADEVAFYHAGYDAEIAYMDQELGRLLDRLRDQSLLGDVVFTADHGEAMGEHDFWFAHGHHLTDEAVRVPLFLRMPGLAPGRRSDVASLVDLRPTLHARLLGEPPPGELAGRDLLAPGAEERDSVPLLSTLGSYKARRYGIVVDGYKLILTLRNDVWIAQLFRQGHEQVDLAAPAPQLTARLRAQLLELRSRLDRGIVAPLRNVSEQERRDLEALGYVHEAGPDPAPEPEP